MASCHSRIPTQASCINKILGAEYKIPSFISEDGADMIKGILETDSKKRFTIEQIRNHPWYKQHTEQIHSGIIVGTDQIPVDENILEELTKYDYDLDYSGK